MIAERTHLSSSTRQVTPKPIKSLCRLQCRMRQSKRRQLCERTTRTRTKSLTLQVSQLRKQPKYHQIMITPGSRNNLSIQISNSRTHKGFSMMLLTMSIKLQQVQQSFLVNKSKFNRKSMSVMESRTVTRIWTCRPRQWLWLLRRARCRPTLPCRRLSTQPRTANFKWCSSRKSRTRARSRMTTWCKWSISSSSSSCKMERTSWTMSNSTCRRWTPSEWWMSRLASLLRLSYS